MGCARVSRVTSPSPSGDLQQLQHRHVYPIRPQLLEATRRTVLRPPHGNTRRMDSSESVGRGGRWRHGFIKYEHLRSVSEDLRRPEPREGCPIIVPSFCCTPACGPPTPRALRAPVRPPGSPTDDESRSSARRLNGVPPGTAFGARATHGRRSVLQHLATGYQEILADPSVPKQIVTMTYPLIGNFTGSMSRT